MLANDLRGIFLAKRGTSLRQYLLMLLAPLVLVGCDFERIDTLCSEYIAAGDMGRFTEQANGIAMDTTSGLEWYRCAFGQRFTPQGCAGVPTRLAWSAVEGYLSEISTKAGQAWRLPTEVELEAITETECLSPALNPNAFPNATVDNHWVTGEGLRKGKPCVVYTYNGARSCRLPVDGNRPFFMVKAR